jgi:hypothetical protein
MQPVSEQQIGKHVPAATNTHATIEEQRFLCGPCREVITRAVGAVINIWSTPRPTDWLTVSRNVTLTLTMSQLSSAREAEKRWRYSSVVGYSPDSNEVSIEAKESPLLRTVTRERLVKAD